MAQTFPPGRTSFSVNINGSTRDKIAKLASDRKQTAKTKNERKSAVFASMDSVGDNEADYFPTTRRRSNSISSHRTKRGTKAHSPSSRKRDTISMSEHSGKLSKAATRSSAHPHSPALSRRSGRTANPSTMAWRPALPYSPPKKMEDSFLDFNFSADQPTPGNILVEAETMKKAEKERESIGKESLSHRARTGRSPSPHALTRKTTLPTSPVKIDEDQDQFFDCNVSTQAPHDQISGKSLDEVNPAKKLGKEQATTGLESSTRRERTGRSPSEPAVKQILSSSDRRERASSVGPLKRDASKRSRSVGPMKKDSSKRSSSVGPMKRDSSKQSSPMGSIKKDSNNQSSPVETMKKVRGKRSSSIGPLKEAPTSPVKKQNNSTRVSKRTSKEAKGDDRTLEQRLSGIGSTRKKVGGGSVASAPVVSQKISNREKRRSSRESSVSSLESFKSFPESESSRRTPPSTNGLPLPVDNTPRGATPSDDDIYIGKTGEMMLQDDTPSKKSPRKLSQRLSNGIRSFAKLTGLGGSQKNFVSLESEAPEQVPPPRKARASSRSRVRGPRSNSAGPLGDRPGMTRADRRAGLTKSKQSDGDNGDNGDNGGGEPGPKAPARAQSMMLHREATRRGKSTSLMDLQQYTESEIHSTSYFASNHVLVNRERMKRGLRPLTRNIAMDELARGAAQKMAESEGKVSLPATYVGNVLRGETIRSIHRATMQNKDGRERYNLLNPYFQDFGVGTSKGKDGMLYVCQLFSERLELTVTDTAG
jgi:hypothetical protein